MLEPLAKTIVQEVVDEGGFYSIEAEGEEYQEITNDISLVCNQKDGDKYIGVDNLDMCYINIYDRKKEFDGWILWIGVNDHVERIGDHTLMSSDYINIDKLTDKWEEEYNRL